MSKDIVEKIEMITEYKRQKSVNYFNVWIWKGHEKE